MQHAAEFINETFDRVIVLTLPHLHERHKLVKETLKGIRFEFYFGVDKNTIDIDKLIDQKLYSPDLYKASCKRPREMNPGMLCCSLGHLQIYQYIIDQKINKAIIFEDDIVVNKNYLPQLSAAYSQLPKNWDLFYLGYEKNETRNWINRIKQWFYQIFPRHISLRNVNVDFFKRYYPLKISEFISTAGYHDCCHAYAITRNAAEILVSEGYPVHLNSDNLVAYMNCTGKIKGYISQYKFFNQLTAFTHNMKSMTS